MSDLKDVQGGTTPEGVHLGAMAGTVDIIQRCYSGIALREGVMWLHPALPKELKSIRSRIQYRGHWFTLHIDQEKLTVSFEGAWSPYARIGVDGRIYTFKRGESKSFDLAGREESPKESKIGPGETSQSPRASSRGQ